MGAVIGLLERGKCDKAILQSMQNALQHRGARDSECREFQFTDRGLYAYGGVVGEGCNDSRILISMDGVVYNVDEIRTQLNVKSDCRECSDLELLVRMYQTYGFEKALQMIDGSFAICLVDLDKNEVFVARDRMGEKPIYYYKQADCFLIASEYKAFYCHPKFKAVLNEDAVSEYFIFRYPAGEMTFLKEVYLVKPGTYIRISPAGISEHAYWTLPMPCNNGLSFDENKHLLRDLISKSVSRRLSEDKLVGVQLSGGADSSTVAAIVREQYEGDLKSFSVIVDDAVVSEEKYIDVVNSQLHLSPHKLNLKASIFLDNWAKATWYYEAPLQHEGNVPLLQLNKEAKEKVSLLFCGDGPDECMGGYDRFSWVMRYRDDNQGWFWHRVQLRNILRGKRHFTSLDKYFISLSQFLTDEELKRLRPQTYKQDIHKAYKNRRKIFKSCTSAHTMHRYLTYEIVTYMLDTLLRGDKMAAASGMEMRAPLLMTELVEFLQTVPEKYLIDYTQPYTHHTKILLKSICSDIYSESFTYRNKVGLGLPMHTFLKDERLRSYIDSKILPGIQRRGIVDYNYVRSIWSQVPSIESNGDSLIQVLWLAFSFEIWAQLYIDGNPITQKDSIINSSIK